MESRGGFNPDAGRQGYTGADVGQFGRDLPRVPDMSRQVSSLAYEFPEYKRVPFGFSKLPVTMDEAPDTSGGCGVYCFRKIGTGPGSVGGLGQEFFAASMDVSMSPGDVAGTGGSLETTDAKAWGRLIGDGYAYLMVGVNTGLPLNRWVNRAAFLPGLGTGASATQIPQTAFYNAHFIPFPAGNYDRAATTAGAVVTRDISSLPLCLRVPKEATLDFAFVLGGAYLQIPGTVGYYYGWCMGNVALGLTRPEALFSDAT